MGTVPAYLVFVATLIWSFSAKTAGRAWLGVIVPGAGLALAYWVLRYRSGGVS